MKKLSLTLVFITNIALAITPDVATKIKTSLKGTLPKVEVTQIKNTPIPNIYAVISNKKVFYVDSSARFLFVGNLIDLATKNNLTQQEVEALNVVNWNELPLEIAIRHVNGNGKRKIAIFTDPDCPFCKRLEEETVPYLNNVTIYYFMLPLDMHKDAKLHAKQILCSETPETTFINWMKDNKKLPDNSKCNNIKSLSTMMDVGNKIGVETTPTIILPDGKVITGLVPADYLNQLITNATPLDVESIESKVR